MVNNQVLLKQQIPFTSAGQQQDKLQRQTNKSPSSSEERQGVAREVTQWP